MKTYKVVLKFEFKINDKEKESIKTTMLRAAAILGGNTINGLDVAEYKITPTRTRQGRKKA